MSRPAICALMFLAAAVSVYAQQQPVPVPLFSDEMIKSFTPSGNPITDAKARLGDMIFDEKRISSDNSVACNTCHSPRNGFTTHTEIARGEGDQLGKRNAPSILNAMFYNSMFWEDYHPSVQQIAFVDTETWECGEQRLSHSDGEAEKFYRDQKLKGGSGRVGNGSHRTYTLV